MKEDLFKIKGLLLSPETANFELAILFIRNLKLSYNEVCKFFSEIIWEAITTSWDCVTIKNYISDFSGNEMYIFTLIIQNNLFELVDQTWHCGSSISKRTKISFSKLCRVLYINKGCHVNQKDIYEALLKSKAPLIKKCTSSL